MGRIAQLVVGPAGCGKSTYCNMFHEFCKDTRRDAHFINLDPAAEHFEYPASFDIRDLITVDDVMEEMNYGPNGALIFCMEYMMQDLTWLDEQLGEHEDDYLVFDCPGQIELYGHIPVMTEFVHILQQRNYKCVVVYMIDSHFVSDIPKFFSGCLSCLSAMMALELPHINVLSKVDLLGDKDHLEMFTNPDFEHLGSLLNLTTSLDKKRGMNLAIAELLDEFPLVSFATLSVHDEESIKEVALRIDQATQYDDDRDVVPPKDDLWDGMMDP